MNDDRWLTIPEAAAHYGVSENAIRMRVKRRKYTDTEKRHGVLYVRVDADAPQPAALVIPTRPDTSKLDELIAAQRETNRLLAELLALSQPKKWRWPWNRP